jgi:D-alanyl-D-alanine carboxypeptidase
VDIRINGWDLAAEDDSTIMGLEAGMRLPVRDLLYGMLLASGNDAALALADHLGGTQQFVALMNAEARERGLTNTNFVTPDGRHHDAHFSTTFDMAVLGRALLEVPALRQAVSTQTYMPQWDGQLIWNNNYMLYNFPGTVGVKTGYTEQAEYTIVAAVEREGRLLIVSVFGSWNLYLDSMRLLDWAFVHTRPAC